VQEVPTEESVLQAAGTALAAGAWSDAYALLLDADRARRLTDPKSVLMLAQAAYDIVKSTNLLAAIGDEAWQHLLRWHDDALASVIAQNGGSVANRTGDGSFATFEGELAAIDAAVAIQRALADHRRTAGFVPQVRIGLHASEADADGSNWTGIGVHEAARIGALAEGDQIVASSATATAAGGRYALSEPRSVTLRGMAEPIEVVTVDWKKGTRRTVVDGMIARRPSP
jgi:class 3 adenylate cyclase